MDFLKNFLLEGETSGSNPLLTVGLLVVMLIVFYFFMIRPQKKQEKQTNEMRNNLEIGDEITTIGGIVGEVVAIRDEVIDIETTKQNTKIRILRSAVRSVDVKANASADDTASK